MEVRVQAEDGAIADGSYIAVRIGEIQKQTLYDPKKVYRFPEARRFGKIDVYSRVGTCDLVWSADQPETRICKVVSGAGDTGTRLRVSMTRPVLGAPKADALPKSTAPEQQESSGKPAVGKAKDQASNQAKKYLQENDVEGILTGAMRALLKVMPDNAPEFLINYISSHYASKKPPATSPPAQPEPAGKPASVVPFREYYREHVLPARGKAFLPDFHEKAAWPAVPRVPQQVQAKPPSPAAEIEDRWNWRPSVATWHGPPIRQVRQSPVKDKSNEFAIEDLRKRACHILVQASLEGTLSAAVMDAVQASSKQQERHKKEWCMRPSIGTWLAKPAPVQKVSRWYQPGGGLRESRPWNLKPSIGTWCAGANVNPEAETGFKKFNMQEVTSLRMQARSVMLEASADGTLESVLREVFRDTTKVQGKAPIMTQGRVKDLREEARTALAMASLDGRLVTALGQLKARVSACGGDLRSIPASAWTAMYAQFPSRKVASQGSSPATVAAFAGAAKASIAGNAVAAANLAVTAAAAAQSVAAGANPKVAPGVAVGLADAALQAAQAGSSSAEGLINAALIAATETAKDGGAGPVTLSTRAIAVQGLASAALTAVASSPVVAAGLAAAAASAAEEMPVSPGVEPTVAKALVEQALAAAKAGSPSAQTLVNAVATAAIEAAAARSMR